MRSDCAVLIDSCVLIGASCPEETIYEKCKPLFDYLKQKPIGIITEAIEESSKKTVSEKSDSDINVLEKLENNIGLLRIEHVDRDEFEDTLLRSQEFYTKLPTRVDNYIAESKKEAGEIIRILLRNVPQRYRYVVKDSYVNQVSKDFPAILHKVQNIFFDKMYIDIPSMDDSMLIAEGYCLKNKYPNFALASADYHLSPIRLDNGTVEPFISNLIREEFGIICDQPDIILQKLRGNKTFI